MDDLSVQLRTRKFNIGDILGTTSDIYRKHFGAYLRVIVLFMLPIALVSVFGRNYITANPLLQLPLWLIGLLPQIGIIAVTHRAIYDGQVPSSTEASLGNLISLIFAAAFAAILGGIVSMIGLILFIIPGIIAAIRLSFSLHALVLRDQNSVDSLSYSNALVKGRGWDVWIIMFVVGIVVGFPTFLLNFFLAPYDALLTPFLTTFTGVAATILFLNLDPTQPDMPVNSGKVEQLVDELEEDDYDWQATPEQDDGDDEVANLKKEESELDEPSDP